MPYSISSNLVVRVQRRITQTSVAVGFLLCSCRPPIGNAIIAEYSRASCVALSNQPKIHPPTREWDATLNLKNGMQVVVTAFDAVGGVVSLRDVTSGKSWAAINPGDYIYPSDLRLDSQRGYLYVRASGLAGGIDQETWLFEYDLVKRQLLRKERVDDKSLPPICS
jgi:hypothetical protein